MSTIFKNMLLRNINVDFKHLNRMLRTEFTKIRQQFDEHLQAINENTNEISSNYEYTVELERKLDRLSERVDQLQLYMETRPDTPLFRRNKFEVKKLDRREQAVFLVIYTFEEEKGSLTYADIANKLNISEQLACNYVVSLIEKGVPLIKRYINSRPYFRLDPEFKTLQAKENILQLSLQEFGF